MTASAQEREHLERAHDEICTALTVLRSNLELVRVEITREHDPAAHPELHRHLGELDVALERLRGLARQMRAWHGPGAAGVPATPGALARASLLP